MDYKFWDANKIYRIKTDIIENIKDILSAVINEGEFYTLKNDIDMAHVDGGIIADNVREVGLIDDNYGISVRIDKPLTGNLIEENIDGYCVDSLLALRNLLFKEIVTPIYEKIEDIAGSIGIKSLPEDFIVTIDDINYGDSFKAVVKHIANNVCEDGGVEIYVVPVDESISKEDLNFLIQPSPLSRNLRNLLISRRSPKTRISNTSGLPSQTMAHLKTRAASHLPPKRSVTTICVMLRLRK